MFRELIPGEFERTRSLFQGFDYSLSVHAAIQGNNPGRILVDDVCHPRTALALTVEGYLLAGDDNDLKTDEALRRLFKERIFTGEVFVNDDWSMSLVAHPETWEAKLPKLIPTRTPSPSQFPRNRHRLRYLSSSRFPSRCRLAPFLAVAYTLPTVIPNEHSPFIYILHGRGGDFARGRAPAGDDGSTRASLGWEVPSCAAV